MKPLRFTYNFGLITVFAFGFAIFLIGMPKYVDDIRFMEFIYPWMVEHGIANFNEGINIFREGFPWEEISKTWITNWYGDNIRLGNLLVVFFLLLPKWVGGMLSSGVWLWCMKASYRLAGIDLRRSSLVALGLVLWVVFMPWENWLDTLVFQFNYILPTGIILWYILKVRKRIWLLVMGLVIGWWNEAFSIPLLASLISIALLYKSERKSSVLFAFLGISLGIIIIAVAPGTVERFNIQVSFSHNTLIEKGWGLLSFNISFYLFTILQLLQGVRKGFPTIWQDRLSVFLWLNGLYNILLSLATYVAPRVTWWAQIVSIIGILYLLHKNAPEYWNSYKWKNIWYVIPITAAALIHLIFVDITVCRINRSFNKAIDNYLANPGKSVFSEVYTLGDYPMLSFNRPVVGFYGPDTSKDISDLIAVKGDQPFIIIPKELQYASVKTGDSLAGSPGVRIQNGRVYIDSDSIKLGNRERVILEVDYGKGYVWTRGYAYKFKSEGDGRYYHYIHVESPWYVQHFKKIRGLRIDRKED